MIVHEARGSLWRRWDPHVHLPGTRLNDQFRPETTVVDALNLLASRSPRIEAIGVTDYLTTASYRRAVVAMEAPGVGDGIDFVFPNVEVRLALGTTSGRPLNLHLLCEPNFVDELDRLLGLLTFQDVRNSYVADDAGLIRLGRAHSGDAAVEDDAALRVGTNQFKVSLDQLRKALNDNEWTRDHLLVAVAGGTNDGTAGLREPGASFDALRQSIEGLAQIMFTGNPTDHAFWLGQGTLSVDELRAKYGGTGQMLCLHGSDAHTEERLGMPDLSRRCWLKGDPTFETVRLACIEPGRRAFVGPHPPGDDQPYGRISEVAVSDAAWLPQGTVPTNPGLIAIIGPRGSGKTALADLIAYGAGSSEPLDNRTSFISRAGDLVDGAGVSAMWEEGAITTWVLPQRPSDQEQIEPVRYLSQQFVERLCATDGVSTELLEEIERVVFTHWPAGERMGATSFRDLLELRLRSARHRQGSHRDNISALSRQMAEQRLLRASLDAKEKAREVLVRTQERLQAESKELTKQADLVQVKRLEAVSNALTAREQQLQMASARVRSITDLQSAVDDHRSTHFPRIRADLQERHAAAGLTDAEWDLLLPTFSGLVDDVLSSYLLAAKATHRDIEGDADAAFGSTLGSVAVEDLPKQTVFRLRAERGRLEVLAGLDQKRSQRLARLNEELNQAASQIAGVAAEIAAATAAESEMTRLQTARLQSYVAYFDALLEEERELASLYAPLQGLLRTGSPALAKLDFSIQRKVDLSSWCDDGEELLDLRKEGTFRGRGELERRAREELLEGWTQGNGATASDAIGSFAQKYSADLRGQTNADLSDVDAYRAWELRVADWLYGAGHVGISYSLRYDGIEVERLSPGARGIVLLLLYLAVDLEDTVPLIIDQPEENLDPESVYTELVHLFREASERRQVIMVTHNANLVVNTDADQVIVASCGTLEAGRLPSLRYLSGGLENPAVRDAVCQVLEGGELAFQDRARRLRVRL